MYLKRNQRTNCGVYSKQNQAKMMSLFETALPKQTFQKGLLPAVNIFKRTIGLPCCEEISLCSACWRQTVCK